MSNVLKEKQRLLIYGEESEKNFYHVLKVSCLFSLPSFFPPLSVSLFKYTLYFFFSLKRLSIFPPLQGNVIVFVGTSEFF